MIYAASAGKSRRITSLILLQMQTACRGCSILQTQPLIGCRAQKNTQNSQSDGLLVQNIEHRNQTAHVHAGMIQSFRIYVQNNVFGFDCPLPWYHGNRCYPPSPTFTWHLSEGGAFQRHQHGPPHPPTGLVRARQTSEPPPSPRLHQGDVCHESRGNICRVVSVNNSSLQSS